MPVHHVVAASECIKIKTKNENDIVYRNQAPPHPMQTHTRQLCPLHIHITYMVTVREHTHERDTFAEQTLPAFAAFGQGDRHHFVVQTQKLMQFPGRVQRARTQAPYQRDKTSREYIRMIFFFLVVVVVDTQRNYTPCTRNANYRPVVCTCIYLRHTRDRICGMLKVHFGQVQCVKRGGCLPRGQCEGAKCEPRERVLGE